MLFNILCSRLALLKTAWAGAEPCMLFSLWGRFSANSSPAFISVASRVTLTIHTCLQHWSLHSLPPWLCSSPNCPSSLQILLSSYSALYLPPFPELMKLGFCIMSVRCQCVWWVQSDHFSPVRVCSLLHPTPQCFGWWRATSLSVSVIVLDNDTCFFVFVCLFFF